MPRINSAGDVITGACYGGTSTFGVNGATPAGMSGINVSTPCFLTDDVVIFQDVDLVALYSFDLTTPATPPVLVDGSGANRLCAGNGRWAAWLAGAGVRSSGFGLSVLGQAAVGDIGADGTMALISSYQQGRGITIYGPSGNILYTNTDGLVYNYPSPVRSGMVAYSTGPGWVYRYTNGALIPSGILASCSWGLPVLINSTVWVLEVGATQLTLRQPTLNVGYVIATGNTFNPDAIEISAGVVRICWSTTAGEAPTQLRLLDLTVADGTNSSGTAATGSIVWTPQAALSQVALPVSGGASSVPPTSGPVIAPFATPMQVGNFFASSEQYGYLVAPGTTEVIVASTSTPVATDWVLMKRPHAVIADVLSEPTVPNGSLIAIWASDVGDVAAARAAATSRGVPIAVYSDSRTYDPAIQALLLPGDLILPQAYRNAGESIQAFETSVGAQLTSLATWGYDIWIVAGAYDRNGVLTLSEMLECFPVYSRLCRYARVRGILFFAWGRPTGVVDYPELEPWIQAFVNAATNNTGVSGGSGSSTGIPPSVTQSVRNTAITTITRPGGRRLVTARPFPHVAQVQDPYAQTSIRLLWDRMAQSDEGITTLQTTQTDLGDRLTTLEGLVASLSSQVQAAQAVAAKQTASQALPPDDGNVGGSGSGGSGSSSGGVGTPGGQGQPNAQNAVAGCAEAGPTGHVVANSPLTPYTVGQICCGTGQEFPALLAVAVDQPTRDANREELLMRMIWHLNLAGFTAGRVQAQNGTYNPWMLGVLLQGAPVYYQVFGFETYTVPMTTSMTLVGPSNATFVPAGGTPD